MLAFRGERLRKGIVWSHCGELSAVLDQKDGSEVRELPQRTRACVASAHQTPYTWPSVEWLKGKKAGHWGPGLSRPRQSIVYATLTRGEIKQPQKI